MTKIDWITRPENVFFVEQKGKLYTKNPVVIKISDGPKRIRVIIPSETVVTYPGTKKMWPTFIFDGVLLQTGNFRAALAASAFVRKKNGGRLSLIEKFLLKTLPFKDTILL